MSSRRPGSTVPPLCAPAGSAVRASAETARAPTAAMRRDGRRVRDGVSPGASAGWGVIWSIGVVLIPLDLVRFIRFWCNRAWQLERPDPSGGDGTSVVGEERSRPGHASGWRPPSPPSPRAWPSRSGRPVPRATIGRRPGRVVHPNDTRTAAPTNSVVSGEERWWRMRAVTLGPVGCPEVEGKHEELGATDTGEDVVPAEGDRQRARHGLQCRIAGAVTQAVVQLLDVVHVGEEDLDVARLSCQRTAAGGCRRRGDPDGSGSRSARRRGTAGAGAR